MNAWDLDLIVVAAGLHDASEQRALARDAERGVKLRVRRGVYADSSAFAALAPKDRSIVLMRALDAASERRPVFSHWSAVVLHGLPFLVDRTGSVDVTEEARTRAVQGSRLHRLPVFAEEVVEVNGLLCTTLERTVVDVAGAARFDEGVVVADAALRRSPAGPVAFELARDLAGPRRASIRIGRVLDFADGRSESPGESLSRVTMWRLGLPVPVLQHVFRDARGFIARTDFWFPDERVAGEMDGRGKYLDPAMNGGDAAEVVYAEKRREDRVRALDVRFARWGWAEARDPLLLGRCLAAAGVRPTRLVRA